jgi:Cof subfamily protein (haloacid dehalogenase superfamily)
LVALDLDGTVVPGALGQRATPSAAVRAAVGRVVASGTPVVIATGRSLWSSQHTIEDLGLVGGRLVCSNGAVVYDLDTSQVTHRRTFDPEFAARSLSALLPEAGFALEVDHRGFRTCDKFQRYPGAVNFLDATTLAELTVTPTTRMIVRADSHSPGDVLVAAQGALAVTGLSWYSQRPSWLDVWPGGVSKATGVAHVAAELGIPGRDVLCVGDDLNDIELMRWAGRSVAMGQAPDQVKRAATHTTGAVEDDGLATALRLWF